MVLLSNHFQTSVVVRPMPAYGHRLFLLSQLTKCQRLGKHDETSLKGSVALYIAMALARVVASREAVTKLSSVFMKIDGYRKKSLPTRPGVKGER